MTISEAILTYSSQVKTAIYSAEMSKVEIKEVTQDRSRICNDLLRALPLWFGIESAVQQYVLDVERMQTFVAYSGDRPIGILLLNPHNEWTAEVNIMAIHPDFHRRGVGRMLLETAERHLRELNYEFLTMKTISPSSQNKEYEITRDFYLAMGFRPVEEFKTLWGEANPCLLMIKTLQCF